MSTVYWGKEVHSDFQCHSYQPNENIFVIEINRNVFSYDLRQKFIYLNRATIADEICLTVNVEEGNFLSKMSLPKSLVYNLYISWWRSYGIKFVSPKSINSMMIVLFENYVSWSTFLCHKYVRLTLSSIELKGQVGFFDPLLIVCPSHNISLFHHFLRTTMPISTKLGILGWNENLFKLRVRSFFKGRYFQNTLTKFKNLILQTIRPILIELYTKHPWIKWI